MQAHAQTTQPSRKGKPSDPARSGAATRSRDATETRNVQGAIGNRAVTRRADSGRDDLRNVSNVTASSRFGHDFARIPVHAKAPVRIQLKLAVNTPGDIYEQEADRLANQVMARPTRHAVGGAPVSTERISESSSERADTTPASVGDVLANPGQPLPSALRQEMERRFGHDFGKVRVHTDRAAVESARDFNAQAFTVGEHIAFNTGRFAPEHPTGLGLLAHELTHVVQQRRGGSVPPLSRSAPHEQDAQKAAREVLTGQGTVSAASNTGIGVACNHDPGDEDPTLRDLKTESGRLSREIQVSKDAALDLLEEHGVTSRPGRRRLGPRAQLPLKKVIGRLREVARTTPGSAARARGLADQLEELRGRAQEVGTKLKNLHQAPESKTEPGVEEDTAASEVEEEFLSGRKAEALTSKEGGGSPVQESTGGAAVTEATEGSSAIEAREFTEHSSMVGGRLFAMVSIAGVLYAISEIHDFASAMRVSESLALTFGAGAVAEAVTASAGVAMVVPMLVGMEDDHGEGVHKRWREGTAVEAFLSKNFTPEQVQKNPDLRRQARKLLFETKPLIIDDMREGAGMGSRAGAE